MPVQTMLSKKFVGSTQFSVGRGRFGPVRVLQAQVTAQTASVCAQ